MPVLYTDPGVALQVSVVVPIFNAERHLRLFLDGLLTQDYPADRYEVLVVDNNSTDGGVAIVERYNRLKLLHEPKQGSFAARNAGVRAAEGDIIAFLDPDCVPAPGWLRAIVRAMDDAGRGIILGKREFDSPSSCLQKLSDYDTVLAEFVFSSESPHVYFGYSNNMAVRRSLFDALGRFHEVPRGADTVFVHNAVESYGCDIIGYDTDVLVAHLQIESVVDFYRKRFLYGTSSSRLRSLGTARPLTLRERLSVCVRTTRRCKYSLLEAAELLVLLSVGLIFYSAGRWRGRLS